ncbi:MAG: glutamine synthetase [Candidatus Thorarchaeota archaeon]|nr:glutamine synthetase [Candidatus Thorarchaeota archaeon]MCK5240486.1 glutamine synthetase [Candidatus Thorarchaeota archaeon]
MSGKIEYVELRIVDILGRPKAMIVPCDPVDTLDELRKDPVLKDGTSVDGSSILGLSRVESSDLRMRPDPSTLIELPYMMQRTAAAMCFVQEKGSNDSDSFYPTDTRGVLHQVCRNLLTKDMLLKAKVEPEFHFVTPEGEKFDEGEYADSYPASPGVDILLEIASSIQEVGMQPRVIHHEVGESQQEIEIAFDDIRRMADNLLIFKNLARAIAQDAGIDVNFMPKPFEGESGNGLHCHLQLWKGDINLFGDDETQGLSETAKNFIAGLLEHARAITAIANPTVNSYKRLVPHHEAPVYISWGMMNRTALIRIPLFEIGRMAAIEFRSPDPMANPYLLFAALLAAGMDGINRKLVPPEPRSEDIFHLTEEQRKDFDITALPANLGEALDALQEDKVIIDALGSDIIERFINIKRKEWNDYLSEVVTEWEWETYSDL